MSVITPATPGRESPARVDAAGPPVVGDHEPPSWLRMVALVPAAGVLAFGSVGLLLAVNGWYRPALAFPLGAVALLFVLWFARPALARVEHTTRSGHLVATIGVVAILAITGWNAAHASQHVLINRDGGSYLTTGRWIARDGSLAAHADEGPFAHQPKLRSDSYAVYAMRDGTIQFQFSHLLPVVLADAYEIGGNRGLVHAPELLGGVALLAFFVLAWRLIRRPWFALAAMLALAFIIPQVSYSRDSYSEIPAQILLFTAGWLIVTSRIVPRWQVAFVAGLFLGAVQAVRIDATVLYISVPPLLALAWLLARHHQRTREIGPALCSFVVGLAPGLALGFVDLVHHSGTYWSDLWPHSKRILLAIAVSVTVSVAVVALWRFAFGFIRRAPWNVISNFAAVLVALVGFVVWVARPHLQHLHGKAFESIAAMQKMEGAAVDPTARYFERSMSWMWWYLGPVTLCAAVVGAALLVRALLRGRLLRTVGVLIFFVPTSVLYLWRASAFPDHVWVTRRFLVTAFPALILLGVGFAARAFYVRRRDGLGTTVRVAAVLVTVLAVAYPVYTVVGVQAMSEKRGFLLVIDDACHILGPNAAVVVLEEPAHPLFDDWVPQTLRSFCGAEVAAARGRSSTAESLRRLAREWDAEGRRLFVASSTSDGVRALLPDAEIVATRTIADPHTLTMTLTHRPRGYRAEGFSMVVASVPSG